MIKNESHVYHLVTRNKMSLGQLINIDSNQHNNLYNFFFERQHLNSKGEDFVQIVKNQSTYEGLNLDKEDAQVAVKYMDQTVRAIRGNLLPKEDGSSFSKKLNKQENIGRVMLKTSFLSF